MKDMLLLANRAAGCSALLLGLVCFGCSDDETEPDGFGGGITAASITTVAPPTSGADTGSSSSSTTTGEAASGDGESTTTGASIEDASSTETPTTGSVDDCPDGTCEPTSTGPAGATTGGGEVTTGGSTGMEQVCEIDVPDPACTGMADGFVYVATVEHGGSEFHDGMSPDKPVSSLMKAIEQALMCPGGCDIVVSHGVYKGSIVLASGVDIYGGYAPETFKYDPGQNPVEVIGTDTRTVIADGLDQPTRLVELTIRGKDFNSEGHSSYGLWARGGVAWSLTVERCEILGGHGGDGLDSGSGTPGESGEPGFDTPTQLWSHGASGGGSACSAAGGAGGFASKCSNGIPSKKGQTPSGGGSGGPGGPQGGDHCTWGIHDDSGGKGGLGQPGGPGSSGAGGAQPESPDGTFSNGLWKGTAGKNGGKGKAGGGGGGGGAGGSDEDFDVEARAIVLPVLLTGVAEHSCRRCGRSAGSCGSCGGRASCRRSRGGRRP
jgi:hypothetical protein